jgi:hypothetical protein
VINREEYERQFASRIAELALPDQHALVQRRLVYFAAEQGAMTASIFDIGLTGEVRYSFPSTELCQLIERQWHAASVEPPLRWEWGWADLEGSHTNRIHLHAPAQTPDADWTAHRQQWLTERVGSSKVIYPLL